jgi:hypothetical protein
MIINGLCALCMVVQSRWSVHMEGEKPKCSKHQWQKTEVKPAAKSWHDVGEDL